MNRMRSFLLVAVFLLGCGAGSAEETGARLFQPAMPLDNAAQTDITTLYNGQPGILERYAWAMSANRHMLVGRNDDAIYSRGFDAASGDGGVWAFVGPQDQHVIRLADGALVIARGAPLANLYAEVGCRVGEWPTLICADGRNRSISAPSATTIRIEDETFELAGQGAE